MVESTAYIEEKAGGSAEILKVAIAIGSRVKSDLGRTMSQPAKLRLHRTPTDADDLR
jgi:hypothetical protein